MPKHYQSNIFMAFSPRQFCAFVAYKNDCDIMQTLTVLTDNTYLIQQLVSVCIWLDRNNTWLGCECQWWAG